MSEGQSLEDVPVDALRRVSRGLDALSAAESGEMGEIYGQIWAPLSLAERRRLARVLERNPKGIVIAQPTRGLDVGATEYVWSKLLEQRGRGAAILLISEDLDEILALADRIAVIYEGELMGILPAGRADLEQLGLLMSGVREERKADAAL